MTLLPKLSFHFPSIIEGLGCSAEGLEPQPRIFLLYGALLAFVHIYAGAVLADWIAFIAHFYAFFLHEFLACNPASERSSYRKKCICVFIKSMGPQMQLMRHWNLFKNPAGEKHRCAIRMIEIPDVVQSSAAQAAPKLH